MMRILSPCCNLSQVAGRRGVFQGVEDIHEYVWKALKGWDFNF
jgi:hypothetical protein